MKNEIPSQSALRFVEKKECETSQVQRTEDGITLTIEHRPGRHENVQIITTSIFNGSARAVTMEMLTSFLLAEIKADKMHRMLESIIPWWQPSWGEWD